MKYPTTPDGRYFVVEDRLWRCANPALPKAERDRLTKELMAARRAVFHALRTDDKAALIDARFAVRTAKEALGERGAPWWTDGAPDYNKKLIAKTPYAEWYARVARETRPTQLAFPGALEANP